MSLVLKGAQGASRRSQRHHLGPSQKKGIKGKGEEMMIRKGEREREKETGREGII